MHLFVVRVKNRNLFLNEDSDSRLARYASKVGAAPTGRFFWCGEEEARQYPSLQDAQSAASEAEARYPHFVGQLSIQRAGLSANA